MGDKDEAVSFSLGKCMYILSKVMGKTGLGATTVM